MYVTTLTYLFLIETMCVFHHADHYATHRRLNASRVERQMLVQASGSIASVRIRSSGKTQRLPRCRRAPKRPCLQA
jgi:hypothetical protein